MIHQLKYPKCIWGFFGFSLVLLRIFMLRLTPIPWRESGSPASLFENFLFFKLMCSFSAYISTGQIMGWGNKAIEIRSVDTGHLDGVFMHKKAQKLKFLCERNDKVSVCSSHTVVLPQCLI